MNCRNQRKPKLEQLEDRRLLTFGEVVATQAISDFIGDYDEPLARYGEFGGSAVTIKLTHDGSTNEFLVVGEPGSNRGGSLHVLDVDYEGEAGQPLVIAKQEIGMGVGFRNGDPWSFFKPHGFGQHIVNVGDLNEDGNDDLAVSYRNVDVSADIDEGQIIILLLDSDGTVKSTQKIFADQVLPAGTSAEDLDRRHSKFGHYMASMDADNNGIQELYMMWTISWKIDAGIEDPLLRSNRLIRLDLGFDGSLTSIQHITHDQLGIDADDWLDREIVAIGDINLDGIPDLAARGSGPYVEGEIQGIVYTIRMNSDGTVQDTTRVGRGSGNLERGILLGEFTPLSLGSVDFNSDGRNELVVPLEDKGFSVLFLNSVGSVIYEEVVDYAFLDNIFGSSRPRGTAFASIGDIDRDGTPDLLIGDGEAKTLHVLQMLPSGLPSVHGVIGDDHNSRLAGPLSDLQEFGASVVDVGDLNKDGVHDLLVGAPGDSGNLPRSGELRLLFMTKDGHVEEHVTIGRTENYVGSDLAIGGGFGKAIAFLGDINGDNYPEVAVSSESQDKVRILRIKTPESLFGIPFGTSTYVGEEIAVINASGVSLNLGRFGTSLANVGDINGDGVVDLAVGDTNENEPASNSGAVSIFFLNSNGSVKNSLRLPWSAGRRSGHALAGLGDVNGDGVPDLAVASQIGFDVDSPNGRISILMLDNDGDILNEQRISESEGNFDAQGLSHLSFGNAMSSIGDLDNNGVPDLVVAMSPDAFSNDTGLPVVILLNRDGTVKAQTTIDQQIVGSPTIASVTAWGGLKSSRQDAHGRRTVHYVTGSPYFDGRGNARGGIFSTRLAVGVDFGDAPDSGSGFSASNYQTRNSDDGPGHFVNADLKLGTVVDAERDAWPDPNALGEWHPDDGLNASTLNFRVGESPRLRVTASNQSNRDANLAAWIDYNGDGWFDSPSENAVIVVPENTSTGTVFEITLPPVPVNAVSKTFARLRLSTDPAALSPIGFASDGEVEDYAVSLSPLEPTLVPIQLKDITPNGGTDFDYRSFITAGETTFFVIGDSQLWATQGEIDDAVKLADINSFTNPIAFGEEVFFENEDEGLWSSDGTPLGTGQIAESYETSGGITHPLTLHAGVGIGDSFYFSESGTLNLEHRLFQFKPGDLVPEVVEVFLQPGNWEYQANVITEWNGEVLFAGAGYEAHSPGLRKHSALWLYDGSSPPRLVKEISQNKTAGHTFGQSEFVRAGNVIYFILSNEQSGRELWITDGTTSGTKHVMDVGHNLTKLVAHDDGVSFLSAPTGSNPFRLIDVRGTVANVVKEFDATLFGGAEIAAAGNKVYFVAPVPTDDHQVRDLWVYDTSENTTSLVRDPADIPLFTPPNPNGLTPIGDVLYYSSHTQQTEYELTRSDGTALGTYLVADLGERTSGVPPVSLGSPLHAAQDQLIFVGRETHGDEELWTLKSVDPAHLTMDSVVLQELDAGILQAIFEVKLSNATDPFSVDFTTLDGTATTAAGDYIGEAGQLLFDGSAGETKTIAVQVIGDQTVEFDENFFVELSNVSSTAVVLADRRASAVIQNNDAAIVSVTPASTQEDAGAGLTFEVTLDREVDVPVEVSYRSRSAGIATPGRDYSDIAGELLFSGQPGETLTVNVPVVADATVELDEVILLELLSINAEGRNVNSNNPLVTGTILNDDQATLTIADVERHEGSFGSTSLSFLVTSDALVDFDLSVEWRLDPGSVHETEPNDFQQNYHIPRTRSFGFDPQNDVMLNQSQLISLQIAGDTRIESDEDLFLHFDIIDDGGRDVFLDNSIVRGRILNDDFATTDWGDAPVPYPVLAAQDGAVHEAVGPQLGELRDTEVDGLQSEFSTGDDANRMNDEDGVIFVNDFIALTNAQTSSDIIVIATEASKLDGWIDFNADGDWEDVGEQVFSSVDLVAGENPFNIALPLGIAGGQTAARFRVSTAGGLAPTGAAADGEVEDYLIEILDGDAGIVPTVVVSGGESRVWIDDGSRAGEGETSSSPDMVVTNNGNEVFRFSTSVLIGLQLLGRADDDFIELEEIASKLGRAFPISIDGGSGNNTVRLLGQGHQLDLRAGVGTPVLRHISTLDIRGAGSNHLILDAQGVSNSASDHHLAVWSDVDDTVEIGSQWNLQSVELVNEELYRLLSQSGTTLQLVGPREWHNPAIAFDINGNNSVEPLDALLLINEINSKRYSNVNGQLPPASTRADLPFLFFDVVADGFVTPLDALTVINFLNRSGSLSGAEGEAVPCVEADREFEEEQARSTHDGPVHLTTAKQDQLLAKFSHSSGWPVDFSLVDRRPDLDATVSDEELVLALDEALML